jgi:apolipoprotein N-acyltransferase
LVTVGNHAIASLICYELAYAQLLRAQLPQAEWIVSLNDDGWFGHSLALYQQLQMAQVLALQTARYHVFSNNDGLSSVIDQQGHIVASLDAFTAGTLKASIEPATGSTPWVVWGDRPIFALAIIGIIALLLYRRKAK